MTIGPKMETFETQINSSFCQKDIFAELFIFRPSLVAFIIFNLVTTPIIILTYYSIIWFGHFGSDSKRTIVNRLTSSACCSVIEYFIFPQTLDLIRIFVGKGVPTLFSVYVAIFWLLSFHIQICRKQT